MCRHATDPTNLIWPRNYTLHRSTSVLEAFQTDCKTQALAHECEISEPPSRCLMRSEVLGELTDFNSLARA